MRKNNGYGYTNIISTIINGCGFESYVEIGLFECKNFNFIIDNNPQLSISYGVDIDPKCLGFFSKNQKCKFINTSSDNFFEQVKNETFDCIFIDSHHSFSQSLKDFKNGLNILNDDGIIFIHDTYPPNMTYTTENYCGDVYKTYIEIMKNHSSVCEIVTLPIKFGLSIVRKRNITTPLPTL